MAVKPFKPPPARATRAILIGCVGLQLVAIVLGVGFDRALTLAAGLVPARLTGAVIGIEGAVPAPLTLVTHMFLHAGLLHLAMNMVFLAWIGRQVEWLIGPWRLLLLFLLGGVAGGLLQVAWEPTSVVPVVGASGAIAAVFATYAMLFAQEGEAPARVLGIPLSGETVRALRYAALWIGLQLLTAVAFNLPGAGGIAIWSHIGGFVTGLLYGLPWVRNRPRDFD
jgi:membrane associated rhomboid family serine protease